MKKLLNTARQLIVRDHPKSIISEQYRTLRTNIKFSKADIKSLLVTSAVQAEGKSTIAANLAYLLAEEGQRVLFIDADLRKPTVHYTFQLKNTIGLSLVLSKQATLLECIQETEMANLNVLTSGPIPPNPSELIGSSYFGNVLKELEQMYDWIVFDTSPLLAVTDTQLLANRVDGTVVVINVEQTTKKMTKKAMGLLQNVNAKIIGVVMNNMTAQNVDAYYSTKYYRAYVEQ